MPLISFVIPIYNASPTLHRCLDSLLSQTESDWEAICINNGSTDVSLSILNEYAAKDKRFKIINQENQGPGVARNCGMEAAQGKYLAFLDADDWLALDMISKTTQLAKTTDADLVSFNAYVAQDGQLSRKLYYSSLKEVGTWRDIKENLSDVSFHSWHMLYKASWIKQHDIRFSYVFVCEDVRFVLDAVLSAKKIAFLDDALYYYRQTKGSTTNKISPHFIELPLVMKEIDKVLAKHKLDLSKDFKTWRIQHAVWAYNQLPLDTKSVFLSSIYDTLSPDEAAIFTETIRQQKCKSFYLFSCLKLFSFEQMEYGWKLKLLNKLSLLSMKQKPGKKKYYLLGFPIIKTIN